MSFTFDLPWNKYGIIVELAKRLECVSPQFGKTALQKMVYLLMEVYNVPCDYEYSLYTYGPYSAELAANVDYVNALGGVKLYEGSKAGYEIIVGEEADHILSQSKEFIDKYSEEMDRLVSDFGEFSARDLELRSTLIFLNKNEELTKTELSKQLMEIKPYFLLSEIEYAIQELSDRNYIN